MSTDIADAVARLMPQLKAELAQLVAIPSISVIDYPEETRPEILRAHDAVAALFREAGVEVSALELPDTAPIIIGEIPAPPGAPTVLLYSHYDVVPVGDASKWESPPFEASERDGAIYGRGAADTKSNILMHIGALRAWGGKPPVGIKIVIEGQEEVGSALTTFPPTRPELFASDAMVIGDMGSVRPGAPTLTIGAARNGRRDRLGDDARRAEAQRPVRRGRARCPARADPRAREPPRRQRRCRRRRAPARGVDGRELQRRGVPLARRGAGWHAVHGHRRPGRADLVRSGADRDRTRRAARRCARERRRAALRAPRSVRASIPSRIRSRVRPRSSSISRRRSRSGSSWW